MTDSVLNRPHRENDPRWPWPCNCDDCCRRAWHAFMGYTPASQETNDG